MVDQSSTKFLRPTWLAVLAFLALVSACGADVGSGVPDDALSNSEATDPVVIVAGTFSIEPANKPLEARLSADGYDANIFVLPDGGTQDIAETSEQLALFVDEVLESSGSTKVDLVGHSQGGLVARYYVKELGGSDQVDSLVTLGAPNYGTVLADAGDAEAITGQCESCVQMAVGSDFLESLNAGDDTIGDVEYTNIYSSLDMVVRPVESAELRDGATNVRIQSQCPFRLVGHVGLLFDGTVYSGIIEALEHRRVELSCWSI